jgi:hypothetical protein
MFDRAAYMREYRRRPHRIGPDKAYSKKWNKSPEGKSAYKKWLKSPKGKIFKEIKVYKERYKTTPILKAAALAAQGGVCKCCGTDKPGSKNGWQVDHIHGTKVIRGILCHDCNMRAGTGSYEHLWKARQVVKYLEPWYEAA